MVFDNKTGSIYLFGRLDEPEGGAAGGGSVADAASASHGSGTTAPSSSPVFTAPRASAGSPPPAVAPGSTDPAPSRTWPLNCAEFYRYHTSGLDSGKWDLLYFDTSASGGPPLVFDHQMVMDAEAQVVYVSGGRVVDGDWKDTKYSGLYSYDVRANKWKMFQSDPSSTHPSIPSRYGHSMVLDHVMQTLFIFAGQRDEKYLSDMYAFHIPTSTVTELFPNFTAAGGPEPCFTQRAVCDPELREIYVFCGLSRNRRVSHTAVLESDAPYWIYRYERPERPGKWTKILPYETSPTSPSPLPVETPSPLPRYAHQVVYDPLKKIVYMHGGNAGLESEILVHSYDYDGSARDRDRDRDGGDDIRTQSPGAHREVRSPAPLGGEGSDGEKENRLDDFWRMKLIRFRELCANAPPLKALAYLQTDVSSVVDHSDAEETRVFRSLLSHLLIPSAVTISAPATPPVVKPYQGGSPMKTTPDKELEEDEAMTDSDTGVLASKSGGEAIDATRDLERPLVISMDRDPEEKDINGGIPSSAEQFKQREKLFEMLMEYINEDAKQPDRDLMRLINVDGDDL
ncbi:hypothetical protein EW026_g555 [Hermanssonia centrifuga]|uniref:Muskelin N-terminal domain-containing protein n=1 Tax=Hermanssonia centrifuga TaxID=98765 RepID=A0A4S4KU61_9APHY|nr:hypothetical protein EW026_g555 [Hermanssonia centrifuga]